MAASDAAATIEALLIELEGPERSNELEEELRSLHSREVLTVIDVVVVNRRLDGQVEARGETKLSADEAAEVQRSAAAALGFEVGQHVSGGVRWEGTCVLLGDEDVRFIAGMLKPGKAAMAVVLEHRWARRLGDLLHKPGIRMVEDDVYTADDPDSTKWRSA